VIRSDFEIHSVLWQGHITLKNEVKCKGEKNLSKEEKIYQNCIFFHVNHLDWSQQQKSQKSLNFTCEKKMNQIFAGH